MVGCIGWIEGWPELSVLQNDFRCLTLGLRNLPGVRACRGIMPPSHVIAEHGHDWPSLTLPVLGGYVERFGGAELPLRGPSAVLHSPGAGHSNVIGDHGLETISVQFDPTWLKMSGRGLNWEGSHAWCGGAVGAAARALGKAFANPAILDRELAGLVVDFLAYALHSPSSRPAPTWMNSVEELIEAADAPPTSEVAARVQLHPAWLSRAYRASRGEGIKDAVRGRRAERAVLLLRTTRLPLVEVAASAGFCDQSHMNRALQAVIGRTPLAVRLEHAALCR